MRRVISIIAALAALAAVVLASELVLRRLFPEQLPSFFRPIVTKGGVHTYGLRPNAIQIYSHLGRTVRVTVGADGWRQLAKTASSSTRNVHVIGDSQVFGWGLSDEETIPHQLQALLGNKVRVSNRGLPGAGPHDYLRQLREVPQDEDVLVVFTETNDLQDTYSPVPIAEEHCGFIVIPNGIARRLPCAILRSRIYGGFVDAIQTLSEDTNPVPLCYNPHLQAACELAMYRAQERLAEAARQRSGKTLFLTVPWEALLNNSALANYVPHLDAPPQRYSVKTLPQHAIAIERLAPLAGQAFLVGDHHLSPAGAKVIAELMFEMLTSNTSER